MKIKFNIKNIKEKILDPKKPIWMIITLALIGGAMIYTQEKKSLRNPSDSSENKRTNLDTFIPSGYVLVALQLTNLESIDSMIGAYSIVDIYAANDGLSIDSRAKRKAIAKHLRLIRAPNNPSLFGVLVSEDQNELIQQLAGPVFAVIQGPSPKALPAKDNPPTKLSRSIKYGDLL